MGSPCRVVLDTGADDVAAAVRDLVLGLERGWTRFIDSSEISALNRSPGRVAVVSPETFRLVEHAVRAQLATGGRFNPLMLRQLEAHGYRRPWDEERPVPSGQPVGPGTSEPIVLYPEIDAVQIPEGAAFDPGGIGKGLAVDLAVELCRERGVAMASIELGGDLRVYGDPWFGPVWRIGVEDPFDGGREVAAFTPTEGAVTTSTTRKRSWSAGYRTYHHLLDPVTGWPGASDLVSVSTCSGEAWWAEVVSKTALLVGSGRVLRYLDDLKTPGVAITGEGRVLTTASTPMALEAAR
jgi:thiamine biosynthesis lipoprotein